MTGEITCIKPVTRLSFYASNGHGLKKGDPIIVICGQSDETSYQNHNWVQEVFGNLVLLNFELMEKMLPGSIITKLNPILLGKLEEKERGNN